LIFTEEQTLIRDVANKFASNQLQPAAAELDRGENRSLFLKHLKSLAEMGYMGLNIDARYGGTEAGTIAFSLAITELARACASTAVTTSVTNMVAEVIQSIGNEDQKATYIPRICDGTYAAASFCLSEAGAGSDPAGMKTTATRDGDDWVLNGNKLWITSAEYAGVFVVWAVTDRTRPKGKGISCFLVEAGTPGITIGKAEHKSGQIASCTNEVIFEQCRVPGSAMLGNENEGFRIAVGELAGGRIGIASLALGVAGAALDYARSYIQERTQFNAPIAQLQGPQWMLAEAYTNMEAARLLTLNAAALKQAGQPFGTEASMAKLKATEDGIRAVYTAQQLMGGIGYTRECPVERYARDIRVTSVYEGTTEVQKVIIARSLFSN